MRPVLVLLACSLLALTACGATSAKPIKAAQIADQIQRQYSASLPNSVATCPSDIAPKAGTKTTCRLITTDHKAMDVFITVKSSRGGGNAELQFDLGETQAATVDEANAVDRAKNALNRDILARQVQASVAQKNNVAANELSVACFQDLPAIVGASVSECYLYQGETETRLKVTTTAIESGTGKINYDITPLS